MSQIKATPPQHVNEPIIIWSVDNLHPNNFVKLFKGTDFPRKQVYVKLDRLFFLRHGLEWIRILKRSYDVQTFADAKIIEIPSKVQGITAEYLRFHPWMLNIMAGACSTGVPHIDNDATDCLRQFAADCKELNTIPCAVSVLTSKTPEMVQQEYGRDVKDVVLDYAKLMESCGITDIVCSPQEAKFLRKSGCQLTINTPGVRMPGSNANDQSRIMTPHDAFAAGANRLIMGRDIYDPTRDNNTDGSIDTVKIIDNIQRIIANINEEVH